MLFRRIKSHIEKENWFAVFVDFFIVVAGVFIGLQVANWNERQGDAADYEQAMERLHAEMRTNYQDLDVQYQDALPSLIFMQTAISDLQNCRQGDEVRARVAQALDLSTNVVDFDLRLEAIEQLVTETRLLDQQSPEVRALLTDINYVSAGFIRFNGVIVRLVNEQVEGAHPMIGRTQLEPVDIEALKTETSGLNFANTNLRNQTLSVPMDVACKDPELIYRLYQWERGAVYALDFMLTYREMLEQWSNALGQPIKKTAP